MAEEQLSDEVHAHVTRLSAIADELVASGDLEKARQKYRAAFELLPEPREDWEAATWTIAAIGDTYFLEGKYDLSRDAFADAVRCAGGLGNAFIHLRLGQCCLELGDRERAADELARAYMAAGREVFENEDPKYFALVESVLKPPPGQDRLP